nr:hypothetical protein [Mangrovicoccus ximenensis]
MVYLASGAWRTLICSERRRLRFGLGIGATLAFPAAVFLQLFSPTLFRYLETGTETALAEAARTWAGPVPLEILRVDAEANRAEIWALVDLPAGARDRRATRPADGRPPTRQRHPPRPWRSRPGRTPGARIATRPTAATASSSTGSKPSCPGQRA